MAIEDVRPILITGVYRSGTTLISRMLNNHPDLSVTYDSVHYLRLSIDRFRPVHEPENYRALVAETAARVSKRWERQIDLSAVTRFLDGADRVDDAVIYHRLMTELLVDGHDMEWGEKTMLVWTRVPDFLGMFPNGRVVHVIRDPRDVLASNREVTYEKGLRYLDAAFACLHSMRHGLEYRACLDPGNYYLLRYEDLVGDPEGELRRLANDFELAYAEEMLDTRDFTERNGRRWTGNSAYRATTSGISRRSVGIHRDKLDRVETFFTEMIAGDAMRRLGYELDCEPLRQSDWSRLHRILSDDFIAGRYRDWLKARDGVEQYPSPPPIV